MNLGTLLGEQQLRIYELEAQLEQQAKRGGVPDPSAATPRSTSEPPVARTVQGKRSELDSADENTTRPSLWSRIRLVLRDAAGPLSIDEIAREIPGESRTRIANNMATRTVLGELVRHGRRLNARYTLAHK